MMSEELLLNIFRPQNTPNLLLYGQSGVGKKYKLFSILKQVYNTDKDTIVNENNINYTYNNVYYVFDMKDIENKNRETFIKLINKISECKNYFGKDKNKLIILKNFQNINQSLQNILRVIFEKKRCTSVFIMITNKYNSVSNPIRSRCLCIRFQGLSRSDKRELMYTKSNPQRINTTLYDFMYDLNNQKDILLSMDNEEAYEKGYQDKYHIICQRILTLYKKKYSSNVHEQLRNISYHIEKYNLSISKICYTLLSYIIDNHQIRDKHKYEIVKLLSESEHNYINSYRSLIVVESLLFQLYDYHIKLIK